MKKLFTFFAAAMLCCAINASVIEWNMSEASLQDLDVSWNNGETTVENNSQKGIIVTASPAGEEGGIFYYTSEASGNLYVIDASATFTFTSTVGKISKIVFNLTGEIDGSIDGAWTVTETTATWEGTPAVSVDLTGTNVDLYFSSIEFTVIDPVAVLGADFEIDLREAPFGEGAHNDKSMIIDAEGYKWIFDSELEPEVFNANFYANSFNSSDGRHGYVGLTADVYLVAGNYKLTLGACQYGNGTGSVKDFNTAETLATFNQNTGVCYHQNTAENVVSAIFTLETDGHVKIYCGNYTPYIALQKLTDERYTITYQVEDEGVQGTIPSAQEVVKGESFTIPANRTLYKEGYTLTGWKFDTSNYPAGTEIYPSFNMTLTAVFTENTASLLSSASAITVRWEFGRANGGASVHFEGNTGFIVTQAEVGGETLDVKLDVDATSGKFDSKNVAEGSSQWCQINSGTKLILPSKKGITAKIRAMSDPINTQMNGEAYVSYGSYIASYTTQSAASTSEFVFGTGTWFSHLEVDYPAGSATAIDQVENGKAESTKLLRNGQILILRGDKTYTLTGQEVK